MSSKSAVPPQTGQSEVRIAVPASNYDYERLAAIYNQARVDYIVPMPMNAKRMAEYVHNYDVNLECSVVSINQAGEETGIGMFGLRDDGQKRRGWITRLGVIPERRGYKVGQFITEKLLENGKARLCDLVQLEVIVGNDPAHTLFRKLGFEDVRELLVIRRPPGPPEVHPAFDQAAVSQMSEEEIPFYLKLRAPGESWIEETPSLLNAGSMRGLRVEMGSERGWVLFQRTPFQLTHFVLSPDVSEEISTALLYHVHKEYPMQDTKVENLAANSPAWPAFQRMGYMEVFRRTEMFLHFR
ncbi:MAG: GNAT family N-acetyltransferase [bacterium]|nr:GNAT family N-acetyltransferase [bacterium]